VYILLTFVRPLRSILPAVPVSGGDSLFHPLLLHSIDPLPSFFSSDSDSLLNFMEENRAYVHTQINLHYHQQQQQQHTEKRREEGREERDYWLGAAAVFAQFEGMEIILLKFCYL